jgi:hypothetical protein
MAISDIFSTSFLFSIGIIIILIGGIFAYVSYRMGEQDHKLNSMIGLISSMAEESRFFRSKIAVLQQKLGSTDLPDGDKIQYASQMMGGQQDLINVSDDEADNNTDDEADNDTDDDIDSGDEDVDNDDADTDDIDDDDDNDIDDDDNDNIKILNLSLTNNNDNDDDNDDEMTDILDIEQLSELKEEVKTVHLENSIVSEEPELEEPETINEPKLSDNDMDFLKHVSITDLGEEDTSKPEYKKMSLNKLREVIINKGIVIDPSKLKKNEILKLLDDE